MLLILSTDKTYNPCSEFNKAKSKPNSKAGSKGISNISNFNLEKHLSSKKQSTQKSLKDTQKESTKKSNKKSQPSSKEGNIIFAKGSQPIDNNSDDYSEEFNEENMGDQPLSPVKTDERSSQKKFRNSGDNPSKPTSIIKHSYCCCQY